MKVMNDLRPVALTSAIMKVCVRELYCHSCKALLLIFSTLCSLHTEEGGELKMLFCMSCITYILIWINLVPTFRPMFFDFSSAFNTIQPHLLAEKLLKMKVSIPTILWVLDYLTDRPQFVKSGSELSSIMLTNTGAPQGSVLSPFLFSLYTADCRSSQDSCPIDKFADDTGLTGLITSDDDSQYRQEVDRFVAWCEKQTNSLVLNVGTTKEMIIDFR